MEIEHLRYYHIIGVWRSGTTLLSCILGGHPSILALPEENLLLFLSRRFPTGYITRKKIPHLMELLAGRYRLRYFWGCDFSRVKEVLLHLPEPIPILNVAKVCAVCSVPAKMKNNFRIIVEKSPASTFYWERLLKHNPEALFMYIYRNPIENTASRKERFIHTLRWTYTLAWWWVIFHQKALQLKEKHADRVLMIKYEELVNDLNTWTGKIAEFLSVPLDGKLAEPHNYFRELTMSLLKHWEEDSPPRLADLLKSYETTMGLTSNPASYRPQKRRVPPHVEQIVRYIARDYVHEWGISPGSLPLVARAKAFIARLITHLLAWWNSWR